MRRRIVNKDAGEIRARVLKAFRELRKEHTYVARGNFSCCGSCASVELDDIVQRWYKNSGKKILGVAFWHHQDNANLIADGRFYIGYGATQYGLDAGHLDVRVGQNLVNALNKNGLETEWNGSPDDRVLVKGLKVEESGYGFPRRSYNTRANR